ncbi:MAG: glycosyltransferase family 4 protein [Candidatus Micrarchaeota archaeon]|nr:glycosyltransferase family 4 protein [Candidatus Micrarchaeota archaeon]
MQGKKTKLLLITNPLQSFGGGERIILEMASRMKREFEITIANPSSKKDAARATMDQIRKLYDLRGVKIVDIDSAGFERQAFGKEPYVMRVPKAEGFSALKRLIEETDCIYMIGLNPPVLFWSLSIARMNRKRFVLGIHNFSFSKLFEPSGGGLGAITKRAFRRMLKMVSAFHVTNNRDLEIARRHYPMAQVSNIPNFVTSSTKSAKMNRKEFICLFVGRLDVNQKGVDYFAKVVEKTLAKNNKIIFEIAGSGGEGERIVEELVKKHRKNVRWLGFVQKDKLEQLYDRVSLLVNTSRGEAFAVVVIEAGSHGVPAIAFDIAGPRDIIKSGTYGKIVPDFDTDRYSNEIVDYYLRWKDAARFAAQKQRLLALINKEYGAKNILARLGKFLRG